MVTTIKPIGGNSAGEASKIAVQAFSSSEILTACKNGSNNLELIGWLSSGMTVTRAADSGHHAGHVDEVALSLLGRRAVTAVRSGSGHLLLISWECPPQLGSITRLADSGTLAGAASLICATTVLTGFGTEVLVTALRTGSGKLKLISWQLQGDGSFTRLGDSGSNAGKVDSIAITSFPGTDLIVSAVQTSHSILALHGRLKLIAWRMAPNGATFTRLGDSGDQAGVISEVAMAATSVPEFFSPGVLTAVKNGSGNLEVIAWRVLNDGIQRFGTSEAGTASRIAITKAGGPSSYVASMRRGSNDIELIAYELAGNGAVTRTASFGERQGTDVSETAIQSLAGDEAVTAIRNRNFLNVNTWRLT
ncbi:hypothetical protein SAMN05519104_2888 [Rhizobiales bacterium GAS188]|nr:hypothetical protein SAMN05519104_2888 [Rhizobiales bacterium GAS188]